MTAGRIAVQVVVPTVVGYGAFLLALWAGSRTPTTRTPASRPPGSLDDWRRLVRLLAVTAVGGYVVFLVLILVFYLALGGQGPAFVADALGSGALLALAVAVPSFLAMEAARAAFWNRRSRRARPSGGPERDETSS